MERLLPHNDLLGVAVMELVEVNEQKHHLMMKCEEQDDQLGLPGPLDDFEESQRSTAWEKMSCWTH